MRSLTSTAGSVIRRINGQHNEFKKAIKSPDYFEKDITEFEKLPPESNGIIFMGASLIRMWFSLSEDMSPLAAVNRGFGGARMHHLIHNAERIIKTVINPRAIVITCGSNDIAGGKSADEVCLDYNEFLKIIRDLLPGVPIFIISVLPNPKRHRIWDEVNRINSLLPERCDLKDVTIIQAAPHFLREDGKPIPELYDPDRLHLNEELGYPKLSAIVKPVLLKRSLKQKSH